VKTVGNMTFYIMCYRVRKKSSISLTKIKKIKNLVKWLLRKYIYRERERERERDKVLKSIGICNLERERERKKNK
jgi:hypothetical protein